MVATKITMQHLGQLQKATAFPWLSWTQRSRSWSKVRSAVRGGSTHTCIMQLCTVLWAVWAKSICYNVNVTLGLESQWECTSSRRLAEIASFSQLVSVDDFDVILKFHPSKILYRPDHHVWCRMCSQETAGIATSFSFSMGCIQPPIPL